MFCTQLSRISRKLYWIELTKADRGVIMQSDYYGENVQPFFNHAEDCSCPYRPAVRPALTVDNTDPQNPVLYWVSLEGYLNIADIDGCVCNLILSPNFEPGLPPTYLVTDKINIYWLNQSSDKLYSINKIYVDENTVKVYDLENARSVRAIGKSLQPYPSPECLIPYQMPYKVEEMAKTSNSITVKLPLPIPQYGCKEYNFPATLYTIAVAQCLEDDPVDCERGDKFQYQTYESVYKVQNLKPFTRYKFKLTLSNYYGNAESLYLKSDPGVILRTGSGAPSKPENVTAQPLTPTLAAVRWMPPKIFNAEAVRYEVHWRSVRLVNGVRPKAEQLIKHTERPKDGRFSAYLNSLLPGQEYLVYVRAYPAYSNDTYSESEEQALKMYPEPNNVTLEGVSVNSLNVSWLPQLNLTVSFVLQYTIVGLEKWQTARNFSVKAGRVEYHLHHLQPKTLFRLRLLLKYPGYDENFVWPEDARFTYQTLGKRVLKI